MRNRSKAKSQTAVVGRVAAGEDGIKSFIESQPVERCRGRNDACTDLAPEPVTVALFEHQACHAEQCFAQKGAAYAGGDLVVSGRRSGFTGNFPQGAADKSVAERFPIVEPGRARKPMVHRALIGMPELVYFKRVVIGAPTAAHVALDRRKAGVVIISVDEAPVEPVQQKVKAEDFEGRNGIAFTCLDVHR